ncbi:hypothetical protein ACXN5S_01685 [Pseudoroseicyclus sp. H15]
MTKFLTIAATALTLGAAPAMADDLMSIATQSGACGSGAVTSASLDSVSGNLLVTCGDAVGVTQDSFPRLRNLFNGGAGGAGGAGAGVGGAAAGGLGAGVTAFGGIAAQLGIVAVTTVGAIAAGNAVGGSTPNTTN